MLTRQNIGSLCLLIALSCPVRAWDGKADFTPIIEDIIGRANAAKTPGEVRVVFLAECRSKVLEVVQTIARLMAEQLTSKLQHMDTEAGQRLTWSIIGFGGQVYALSGTRPFLQPKFTEFNRERIAVVLPSTASAHEVGEALCRLPNMGWCPMRTENLDQIRFVLSEWSSRNGQQVIVLMSYGSDPLFWSRQKRWRQIPELIEKLRAARTAVHVITGETAFQCGNLRLQGPTGATGPYEGYLQPGVESGCAEVLSAYPFTVRRDEIPSRFCNIEYHLLAEATGGKVVVLRERTAEYDEEKLLRYAPEVVTYDEYKKRWQESVVRQRISEIGYSYDPELWSVRREKPIHPAAIGLRCTFELKGVGPTPDQCRKFLQKAKRYEEAVSTWIEELEPLRTSGAKDPFAPERWEANLDLNLALLYKIRFLLPQAMKAVENCLMNGFPEKEEEDHNAYGLRVAEEDIEVAEGSEQAKMLREAEEALDQVMEKHAGTPWAEVARREKAVLRKRIVMGTCRIWYGPPE